MLLLHRRFELTPEYRERRTQLVRDVGRKPIDVLEGVVEPLHHPVERHGQPLELVARLKYRQPFG